MSKGIGASLARGSVGSGGAASSISWAGSPSFFFVVDLDGFKGVSGFGPFVELDALVDVCPYHPNMLAALCNVRYSDLAPFSPTT